MVCQLFGDGTHALREFDDNSMVLTLGVSDMNMATLVPNLRRKPVSVAILCFLSFLIGYNLSPSPINYELQKNATRNFDVEEKSKSAAAPNFEPHHTSSPPLPDPLQSFPDCPNNFSNYCPCQDYNTQRLFTTARAFNRERHCPEKGQRRRCLVPKPSGYRRPIQWPKSKNYAWFSNVPYSSLTEFKKPQNWVRLEDDLLFFPGGGTSFPKGVKGYIDELKLLVPLNSGSIRTALDVGCGVASFGASLLDYKIMTMSLAPVDIHEAQVQFALERGLPAILGVLSTYRLPFPSRCFDMIHCARCLVPWLDHDGVYLMEVDRLLSPGGYWVLSGPPISWKTSYKGWETKASELEAEQNRLEDLAKRLCWKKVREKGRFAVWQKPTNHFHCAQKMKSWKTPQLCAKGNPDGAWYKKMETCITPLPKVENIRNTAGGSLEKWPKRLNAIPPRIKSATTKGITMKTFNEDNQLWRHRISYYRTMLRALFDGTYRNVMDMNAGLGGFAAALSEYPVWVMNVIPHDAPNDTLGIVYERGLIGSYMDWCEPFSTYPRTYDLIHADGLFSMYMDKCDILDILFEMQRIIRPQGAIIVRDHDDVVMKIKETTERMRWNAKLSHNELTPYHSEKILFISDKVPL